MAADPVVAYGGALRLARFEVQDREETELCSYPTVASVQGRYILYTVVHEIIGKKMKNKPRFRVTAGPVLTQP